MASRSETVAFIVDQAAAAGAITTRKMFGEYALYCDGKVVALVCDDALFVKPTAAGRAYLGQVEEQPAYRGAKPSFFIAGDLIERGDWLAGLIRHTADALPPPAPRAKPRKRGPMRPAK